MTKQKKKRKTVKAKQEQLPVREEAEEKPFDFGGLPQRDLKKNLGCG